MSGEQRRHGRNRTLHHAKTAPVARRCAAMAGAVVAWLVLLTGASAATQTHTAGAHAAGSGGTWGTAEKVRGLPALNTGGGAAIESVSCPSAGNCGAGGWYYDKTFKQQAFVVSEANGTWGTAEEVPGTAALNKEGSAAIAAVSCATNNHCSAGGYYSYGPARSPTQQAFTVGAR